MNTKRILELIDRIYLSPTVGGRSDYDRTPEQKLAIIEEVLVHGALACPRCSGRYRKQQRIVPTLAATD